MHKYIFEILHLQIKSMKFQNPFFHWWTPELEVTGLIIMLESNLGLCSF